MEEIIKQVEESENQMLLAMHTLAQVLTDANKALEEVLKTSEAIKSDLDKITKLNSN